MSKLLKVQSALTLIVLSHLVGHSPAATAKTLEPQRTIRFEPCSRWRVDTSTGLSSCVFVGQQITVEDAQTTQRLAQIVAELRQEIDSLKKRVSELENQ